MKMKRMTAPAVFAVLALLVGAWSFSPGTSVFAQQPVGTGTPSATTAATTAATTVATTAPTSEASATPVASASPTAFPNLSFPSGSSSSERQLLNSLYGFNANFTTVTSAGFVQQDRTFLDVLWAENVGGLQMTRYAMSHAQSSRVRELATLMYQMHLKDQAALDQFENLVTICTASGAGGSTGAGGSGAGGNSGSSGNTGSSGAGSSSAPGLNPGLMNDGRIGSSSAGSSTNGAPSANNSSAAGVVNGSCGTSGSGSIGSKVGMGNMGASGALLSLSNVPVLPQTALGSLGFSTIDLKSTFMDKITNVRGSAFDGAFLTQMMAAHDLGAQTAQAVATAATEPALRGLAVHLQQEENIHHLLMLQLFDRLFYGLNLTVVFPTSGTASQTPTAIPSATMSPTEVPSMVPTATASESATPSETATATSGASTNGGTTP